MGGEGPFLGSEAIASGVLRKHQLRSRRYCRVFPGVYQRAGRDATLRQRATAAWLWSGRRGVLAGATAAALHGTKWVDDGQPVELIWSNTRPPHGISVRNETLRPDEWVELGGLPVTTAARTGFDLGRLRFSEAVARLDALGNATGFSPDAVRRVAANHRNVRGLRNLEVALANYDPGSASPKETWLRLLLVRAGFPRPQTQIQVRRGYRVYYLDMVGQTACLPSNTTEISTAPTVVSLCEMSSGSMSCARWGGPLFVWWPRTHPHRL